MHPPSAAGSGPYVSPHRTQGSVDGDQHLISEPGTAEPREQGGTGAFPNCRDSRWAGFNHPAYSALACIEHF